jgi:RHS repeat-associated protein
LDKKGTTVITDELIGYDQDANPVCVRDSTTGNPSNRDFTYDARNRLIKASAPNQAWISSEYQYDSLDNIKLARLGTRHYNYTQNALNQLASITQPSTPSSAANYGLGSCADASLTTDLGNGSTGPSVAIPSAGTPGSATTGGTQTAKYTFSTDNEGRMTQKGTQAYVYDALNRMTQVTTKESYVYDGHGRRVQITKTADGSINYPLYSLDGKLILEDNRQTLQRIEYIHAGGRLVAKKIQPITAAGANNGTATTTTIHTDFLGSPVAETNSAGTVSRVERYTPYGEPSDMQLDAGPGFTGHATDVVTGLTNMQQRYMDAELGRFLTPDPQLPDANTGANINRYWYADNNPIKNLDPDGKDGKNAFSPYVTDELDNPVFYNTTKVLVNDTNTGLYFFGGHAASSFIQDRSPNFSQPENLDSGQKIINNSNGLKPSQTILFAACQVGIGSLAQSVSNLNKSTVYAPDGYVSFQKSGDKVNLSVWSGLDRTGKQGSFLKFSPGGSNGSMSGSIKSIDVNMKSGEVKVNFSNPQSVTGSNIKVHSTVIKKE